MVAMTTASCGAVILAGGLSRRMGKCKASLPVDGQSMLQRTQSQLSDFDEILLSCNDMQLADGFHAIRDIFTDCGPLAGIHAAMLETRKDALFAVPCDLPNFSRELPRLLLQQMEDQTDILICQDSCGGLHPLCGIYRKRTLPVLEQCLREGSLRVMDFFHRVNGKILPTEGLLPDELFFNMNTPQDYQKVLRRQTGASGLPDRD